MKVRTAAGTDMSDAIDAKPALHVAGTLPPGARRLGPRACGCPLTLLPRRLLTPAGPWNDSDNCSNYTHCSRSCSGSPAQGEAPSNLETIEWTDVAFERELVCRRREATHADAKEEDADTEEAEAEVNQSVKYQQQFTTW